MMRKTTALLVLVLIVAVLPLMAHAVCQGGFADGRCESGDNCDCTDCWGLSPPGTFKCSGDYEVCLEQPGGAHMCKNPPAWYQPEVERVSGNWQTWGPIASLAVIVSMLVVALAYMLGIGFDLPELRMWAKSEFYQALANAVIVGSLVALVAAMTDQGFAHILGQNINPFSLAMGYLLPLAEQLKSLYAFNYAANFGVEWLASFDLYTNATGTDIYLFAFLKPMLVEPLHLANHYVIQAVIMVWFQIGLLNFFQKAAFGALLPMGVFLRIFPFTRGVGALLISMAIAFFLVYPTMFGFITMMTEEETALRAGLSGDNPSNIGVDLSAYNACDRDVEGAAGDAEKQTDPAIISKINEYYSFLPPIIMKIMFYPLVVFAVTFTFIKMASPLLGADISEVGQGLVRLI